MKHGNSPFTSQVIDSNLSEACGNDDALERVGALTAIHSPVQKVIIAVKFEAMLKEM